VTDKQRKAIQLFRKSVLMPFQEFDFSEVMERVALEEKMDSEGW